MMVPLIKMMLFIDVDVKNLMKNIRLIRWQIFLYIIKKGERKLMLIYMSKNWKVKYLLSWWQIIKKGGWSWSAGLFIEPG